MSINKLSDKQAVEALDDLKKPHVFIQGNKGYKLDFTITTQTLDTKIKQKANDLINSGFEGSCINQKYAMKHKFKIQELSRDIPVFNTDGSLNMDGAITGFITLQLEIGKHVECINLGVTNLSKGDIFLGHDGLRRHN